MLPLNVSDKSSKFIFIMKSVFILFKVSVKSAKLFLWLHVEVVWLEVIIFIISFAV